MDIFKNSEVVYSAENDKVYIAQNGVYIRDITVNIGIKKPIYVGHINDLHYNFCNEQDFSEGNSAILSTYENRLWLKNAASVPIVRECLKIIGNPDLLVVNGDTLDYLSHGAMELMQKEIWDKYSNIIATIGGHECTRVMQGKVADNTTLESRLEILQIFWKHDIFYTKVIINGVMFVGICNDMQRYTEAQFERLREDIEFCRKNSYKMLLFQHEPIHTNNPKYKNYTVDDLITKGDLSSFPANFCDMPENRDDISKKVYSLIFNSSDVIKAIFAGHMHCDMYLEIHAKDKNGNKTTIPQYVHTVTSHQKGHLMRIFVK